MLSDEFFLYVLNVQKFTYECFKREKVAPKKYVNRTKSNLWQYIVDLYNSTIIFPSYFSQNLVLFSQGSVPGEFFLALLHFLTDLV